MRIGSLCTGYDGLAIAIQAVMGGHVVWTSDIDKGARKIIAHRYPDAPNLGDLTVIDWATLEPVDLLCAGYPCQPFSHAGRRKGTNDERHLWPYVREAIRVLRPRLTLLENVAGHRSLGFDRVLGDLAEDGMHVRWTSLRAADIGAPHNRERLFILVEDAERSGRGAAWDAAPGEAPGGRSSAFAGGSGGVAADEALTLLPTPTAQEPGGTAEQYRARWAKSDGRNSTFVPLSMAVNLLPTPKAIDGDHPGIVTIKPGQSMQSAAVYNQWGDYAAAIARWEHVLGRPAPEPTQTSSKGNPQLSPAFVEWMMGLPAGWVTDVPGITHSEALKALGNGVVPQQAAEALRVMASWERVAA